MALQSSGTISLSDIQTEFDGVNPISLSEYYRNGSYVTSNNTGVPTSGTIALSDFYGAENTYYVTISSSAQNANIRSLAIAAGWDGSTFLDVTINSSVWLWSNTTATAGAIISGSFPSGVTIHNYGKIIGMGGAGGSGQNSGAAGGPALSIASSGVIINNKSGAYIAGGGGGGGGTNNVNNDAPGGGGAGGGAGGAYKTTAGGAGGSIGSNGSNGGGWNAGSIAFGGSAGGAGGLADESSGGSEYGASAGGGGRVLPGTQTATATLGRTGLRALGKGGGGGQAGTSGGLEGNGARGSGGGGWGSAGGGSNGGAAGAAISKTVSYTLNNSGTVYGAT